MSRGSGTRAVTVPSGGAPKPEDPPGKQAGRTDRRGMGAGRPEAVVTDRAAQVPPPHLWSGRPACRGR